MDKTKVEELLNKHFDEKKFITRRRTNEMMRKPQERDHL